VTVAGSGTPLDPYKPNLATHWAAYNGPTAWASAYKVSNWAFRISQGSSFSTAAADGITINETGYYEVYASQRASGNASVYVALSVNGDRTALESRTTGAFTHDHSQSVNQFTTSRYIGLLNAGEKICCGAPDSTVSGQILYGASRTYGQMEIKRLG
jgi:hypothetical protein